MRRANPVYRERMSEYMNARHKNLYTAAICCCTTYLAIINASHGTLLSSLIEFYRLTDSQQGYPNSFQNIGCIIAVVSSLFLIGRVDKHKLHMFALILLVGMTLPLSMDMPFPSFIAAFTVLGIGFGFVDVLNSSMVADLHQGKRAEQMMCLMHGCHGAAGILFPVILNQVLRSSRSWERVYVVVFGIGVIILLYVLPTVLRLKKEYVQEVPPAAEPVKWQAIGAFFRNPLLCVLVCAIFFHAIYQMGLICWVKRYMEVELASDIGSIALSLYYLGMTASRFIVPLLHIPVKRYICWSSLLSAVLILAGILLHNSVPMCVCISVGALLNGAMIPVIISNVCQIYQGETFLPSTLAFVFLMGGYSVSSPLIGALESVFGMTAAMAVCAAAVFLNGLVVLCVPARKQ